ncbi:uncharacterized protein LOC142663976 [Rhinoderma darwinii]|uniref:uncharacterized protein LOC142663976 n=1 Tax=Rhinoderma darwinii TaxID=43563 RepID=UPI003F662D45
MESSQNPENGDSAKSHFSNFLSVPKLTEKDMYHVFVSFSTEDSTWVHQLILKLEVTFPSIKICSHDRDFTAGKTIIENLTECIQKSQKILMVLSPDFVHSRWCLFEANLSVFQDCKSDKAVVPIMLKPCPMPLYLSHLTYLEVKDEHFFEKLCNRLLKNYAKETEDILVHFQSSLLYGGKHMLSLAAVNENDEEPGNGAFSDTCVPDPLKAVVKDPEIYKKAIRLINNTPTYVHVLNSNWTKGFVIIFLCSVFMSSIYTFTLACSLLVSWYYFMYLPICLFAFGLAIYKLEYWKKKRLKIITRNMSRRTGEANLFLVELSILAGCASNSSLDFVFVSLKECKTMFQITFEHDPELEKCMWEKAMIQYSSDYANCMARKYFPHSDPLAPGHLANGICFCQYVAMQIKQGYWP